ncbi:ComEC/Rec2 family competence protein [Kordia zhangzhouensis]|uniref:ComEC/Rec2 family competence protein n=1 Tax=Kordia zhangzhouensis TaxID=1620405 RepID=UPI000629AF29|nr:ComEC/Rec2 family competence protein [Kordia zhangzhouensis]
MKWLHFTITKLTISLIFGILLGYYFSISIKFSLFVFGTLSLLMTICFWIARKQFIQTIYFGMFALLTMTSLGIVIENFHNERLHHSHFSHLNTIKNIQVQVREVLKPNNYYNRYYAKVIKGNDVTVSGKLLLLVQKDSLATPLAVDDVVYTNHNPEIIRKALNPSSFDYKMYLNDRYIYHQLQLQSSDYIVSKTPVSSAYGFAYRLRTYIHNQLIHYGFSADELAVLEALILGQRQDISKELQTNYVNAGAIHILAISGLHIGILVMILQFILTPLQRLKHGKNFKLFLILLILWGFAFISGASASVVRAVTMFTALVIATHFKRQTDTLQVLIVSMFFLLLFKPHFLFDIGFQLSYTAVFAIVCLQPLWKKLWNPKSLIPISFWNLLTVSLSAQLGVLPLSLYYFHQFPGLFFVTNLTIIPILGFVLIFGIIIILLASAEMLPIFLADSYVWIIQQMNSFVSWVASHDQFVLQDIPMHLCQLFGSYIVLIAITYYLHFPKKRHIKVVLYSVLICQGLWFYNRFQLYATKDSFSIFHQNKASIMAIQKGTSLAVYHSLDSLAFARNYTMQRLQNQEIVSHLTISSLQNVYKINGSHVLRVDSLGIYKIPNLNPSYVILTNSPKINLNRLIKDLKPKQIIADGSNYKSYINRWQATTQKQKIPFHYTGEKGFFSISLKK